MLHENWLYEKQDAWLYLDTSDTRIGCTSGSRKWIVTRNRLYRDNPKPMEGENDRSTVLAACKEIDLRDPTFGKQWYLSASFSEPVFGLLVVTHDLASKVLTKVEKTLKSAIFSRDHEELSSACAFALTYEMASSADFRKAAQLKVARHVVISGVTGPMAATLNGTYSWSSQRHHDHASFKKVGESQIRLMYAKNDRWVVSDTHSKKCLCACLKPNISHPTYATQWLVSNLFGIRVPTQLRWEEQEFLVTSSQSSIQYIG